MSAFEIASEIIDFFLLAVAACILVVTLRIRQSRRSAGNTDPIDPATEPRTARQISILWILGLVAVAAGVGKLITNLILALNGTPTP